MHDWSFANKEQLCRHQWGTVFRLEPVVVLLVCPTNGCWLAMKTKTTHEESLTLNENEKDGH
jgi:hypothetical protein